MEKHGLCITRSDNSTKLFYKMRLCFTVGDIPAILELCKHSGHSSYKGCRICRIIGKKNKLKVESIFQMLMNLVVVLCILSYHNQIMKTVTMYVFNINLNIKRNTN